MKDDIILGKIALLKKDLYLVKAKNDCMINLESRDRSKLNNSVNLSFCYMSENDREHDLNILIKIFNKGSNNV